jgi:hypothetical protein
MKTILSILLLSLTACSTYKEDVARLDARYAVKIANLQKAQANLPVEKEPKTYEEKILYMQQEQLRLLERQQVDNAINRYKDAVHNRTQKVYFDRY